jgi:hypothetical protein
MNKSRLIGQIAHITDRDSIYYKEWGTISDYDGEYYYIRIADGNTSTVFKRNEFKIRRS